MSEIVVFKAEEQKIMETLKSMLRTQGRLEELVSVEKNEAALVDLSAAISLYPSILGHQSLGRASRSIETLVNTLCLQDLMDLVFHIPTKAILGQSYSLAKINFFYMLLYLTREIAAMRPMEEEIREIISINIFGIMAEDVFISIISDKTIPMHIRNNAGYLLASIWEHRVDYGVDEFAPALTNIWHAREKIDPNFGTMMGISELFMLSQESDPIWFEFLQRDDLKQDEIDALQEFLMGLSFEEIMQLSDDMKKSGRFSIDKNEIREKEMGEEKINRFFETSDPRRLFKSFSLRKSNSIFRARGNAPGPKKTLEEYLMSYLLARPGDWTATSKS